MHQEYLEKFQGIKFDVNKEGLFVGSNSMWIRRAYSSILLYKQVMLELTSSGMSMKDSKACVASVQSAW